MRVFAIDPGNTKSAYCIMSGEYELIEFGKKENEEVMDRLVAWAGEAWAGDKVVIERMMSYGMKVGAEVFMTCEWIGRFAQEIRPYVLVDYVYRPEEKLWICQDSRAKDTNIRQALIERFAKHDKKNGKGTKSNPDFFYGVSADCWAAIAVAVTKLDMMHNDKLKCIIQELKKGGI